MSTMVWSMQMLPISGALLPRMDRGFHGKGPGVAVVIANGENGHSFSPTGHVLRPKPTPLKEAAP
jgi:hypothetical protein